MVPQALHEHAAAQAAKDDRLTRSEATNPKHKVRKILDTTDRANAVLAAAGYNFSLLLRWFEALWRALIEAILRTPFSTQTN